MIAMGAYHGNHAGLDESWTILGGIRKYHLMILVTIGFGKVWQRFSTKCPKKKLHFAMKQCSTIPAWLDVFTLNSLMALSLTLTVIAIEYIYIYRGLSKNRGTPNHPF